MKRHKGRCLCGQIRFEFQGEVNWGGHCHCDSCRRNTSSPLTTFIGVNRDRFQFTRDLPSVFESSPGVRRHFCSNCGSPVAYDADAYPEEIHFYVAAMENPEDFQPQFHVFTQEKLSWLHIDENLKQYRGSESVLE